MVATVGLLGPGRIGEPMVERLLAAGHDVTVHARRAEVRDRLAARGARPTDTAVEVAEADVVVSCLYDDAQLREVAAPVVAAMRPDTVFVSHTTGTPRVLDELAALGRAGVVDAPFSGTAEDVCARSLTVYLGGSADDTATARRVLAAYADPILPTGARGTALRTKLLNNLLFGAISRLTLAAVEAGRELGIDEAALLAALRAGSGG
ncbi:NAD(P)-dependent oxidoreductase, partial [Pseudonocardia pini]|uniref:NAD(P)-dependent oxidoreductase n=1 Tax=Pseudonocardia pini TaxID=2758030 RepID=UPI0015F01D05